MGECDVLIYGMTLAHMNQLSTLGWKDQKPNADKMSVYAGDASGMSLVFTGTIFQAVSDFQGGPNLPFHVVSHAGSRESALKIKPTSINNKSADVAQISQNLAGQMGLQFENNGVNVKLAYPYLSGTARTQMAQLAKHANINWTIDRETLAISPSDGARNGASPLISPKTGMVGYPSWSSAGIKVRTLFNNELRFNGKVQIQSSVAPANGEWTIFRIEHNLQALTPNGEWFTTIEAWNPKIGSTPPA